ncbi:MAG: hypothetical protein WBH71_01475 [Bacteroidales bacterium]|jgi:hypothetical protein|nr:hypothetical protein [Bacteroidales bacterium]MDI9592973.1 hypothetical protein [Bacteroidota bacterium]OQC38145.1 MAG: hypothetical protein BWX63_00432 [Bacteroidetes bacterium ADurb.Bin041]HQK40844.1 hypothetical protein [Flavobacterium alvei]MBP7875004.1 hypothetical protein [Bacteroidales bacterium]
MRNFILILTAITLASVTCNREGESCHRKITIINHSTNSIVQALNIKNAAGKCFLTGSILLPEEIYEYTNRSCFEDILSAGETFEFYLIDPNHYNTPGIFYDCDSIEIKNTILKHYLLTLDELKSMNFTVNYP